jgi:hypothetical protein
MYWASPAIKITYYILKQKETKSSGHIKGECCLPEH